MLKKRIIPCLDIKDGRTVKGVNFVGLRDAGDPVELAKVYAEQGADELVFLDITATVEKRKTLVALVDQIAKHINLPFTVGGGISSVEDVRALLAAGADKVTINSAAVRNPDLINQLAYEFGSQCVVVAVDSRFIDGKHVVHVDGGRTPTEKETLSWAKELEERGAGELLLTSMDHDGTKAGFADELNRQLAELLTIPVVASGGAGNQEHFKEVFENTGVDAALAAGIFHFKELSIPELKQYLHDNKIAVRIV
ncbi:MAG: imidazole glycerol phosphate synthase subunit HisF [Cyclobacteriaceae bacterium]|nr:imidazole glycerol phosphate synthase subunit HisF [Cyclobacteriaceae bacterium]MCH8516003.1 imidazole glycerol phosphate synthase subunit HisF [Cyclobacteriaceae bacterium]